SGVTVPVFGFGIRPRGPSTRPRRPTLPIMSGVATTASKSRKPPWIRSIMSSEPTKSAPAARASSARSPLAKTSTRAVLPVPLGRLTEPQGHLDGRVELRHLLRLGDADRLGGAVEPLAVDLLGGLAVRLAALHVWSPHVRRSWSAGRARPCHYVLDGYNAYFSTLMPIERAVPAMIFSAASIVVAFRSGILVCAMSRTWAAEMLPTLVLCGSALPLSTPAAFLISSGAGGVFVIKVNVRSS